MSDFILNEELLCEKEEYRIIEKRLLHDIIHIENINDDYVIEPVYSIDYSIGCDMNDFGVGLKYTRDSRTQAV